MLTVSTQILNVLIDAVALLGLSWVLPRRTDNLLDLDPGRGRWAASACGVLHIATLVYFPSKIERASALYGTLGVALVALVYLFVVGQILVASAIANTVWFDRHDILEPSSADS